MALDEIEAARSSKVLLCCLWSAHGLWQLPVPLVGALVRRPIGRGVRRGGQDSFADDARSPQTP